MYCRSLSVSSCGGAAQVLVARLAGLGRCRRRLGEHVLGKVIGDARAVEEARAEVLDADGADEQSRLEVLGVDRGHLDVAPLRRAARRPAARARARPPASAGASMRTGRPGRRRRPRRSEEMREADGPFVDDLVVVGVHEDHELAVLRLQQESVAQVAAQPRARVGDLVGAVAAPGPASPSASHVDDAAADRRRTATRAIAA